MIGAQHVLREIADLCRHLLDPAQIGMGVNIGGGRNIEALGNRASFNHGIVSNYGMVAHHAIEQHRVEADEDVVPHDARAVNDGAVGDRGGFPNLNQSPRLGMDYHTILDV